MSYGIDTNRHGNIDFLNSLAKEGCLSAYLVIADRFKAERHNKQIMKMNYELSKIFSGEIGEYVKNLTQQEKNNQMAKLFTMSSGIDQMPVRSLIHPKNKDTLNKRICKVTYTDKIESLEKHLQNQKEFNYQTSERIIDFTSSNSKMLTQAIIRLNWFLADIKRIPLISPKNPFSQEFHLALFRLKSTRSINEFIIRNLKKDKKIVKKSFNKIPYENMEKKDLIDLLSSFSLNTFGLFELLTDTQTQLIMRNYEIFRSLTNRLDSWSKAPIHFLYSFEQTTTMNKALQKCERQGFKRLKHLRFLDPIYRNLIENRSDFEKFLNALERNFKNWKA
tara:strand:- start:1680 stop:2681 length:1002 start_codon:yes stop_codon:yes gene_type:complete